MSKLSPSMMENGALGKTGLKEDLFMPMSCCFCIAWLIFWDRSDVDWMKGSSIGTPQCIAKACMMARPKEGHVFICLMSSLKVVRCIFFLVMAISAVHVQ